MCSCIKQVAKKSFSFSNNKNLFKSDEPFFLKGVNKFDENFFFLTFLRAILQQFTRGEKKRKKGLTFTHFWYGSSKKSH
jgi:hypothetical protein